MTNLFLSFPFSLTDSVGCDASKATKRLTVGANEAIIERGNLLSSTPYVKVQSKKERVAIDLRFPSDAKKKIAFSFLAFAN